MSAKEKKKKKVQVLLEQPGLIGSADYIANREIDQIIKKGKERLKHAITLSDEKLTKTKKEIIKEMAEDLEKARYPVNEICDRLTKSLKGLVNERTVRDALDTKYKNPEQSEVAKMQNYDGGSLYRQQEQLRKKDIKEITFDDLKLLTNLTKVKQVAKHQMAKAEWWIQQAKQNEAQQTPTPTKQDDPDKDKIIVDLKKENDKLTSIIAGVRILFMTCVDPKLSDEEVGEGMRQAARDFLKTYRPKQSKK